MNDTQLEQSSRSGAIAEMRSRDVGDITMSSCIDVDSRRMLQALSTPEYIEAWLQPPSLEETLAFDFVTHRRFQISLYRAEAFRGSIHGAIRVVSQSRVSYMWKVISACGISHTTVDINVLARTDRETITLRHSGFHNPVERAWHYSLWEQSLGRLCGIVRPVD